ARIASGPSARQLPTPSKRDDSQAATPSTTAASTTTDRDQHQRILEPYRKCLNHRRRHRYSEASYESTRQRTPARTIALRENQPRDRPPNHLKGQPLSDNKQPPRRVAVD